MTLSKPAWLDSMYNNRMLVPAFAQHMAQWQADSAQARLSLPCELDVAYGGQPGETLDFFPAKRSGSPVVVFIHGGYWRALDKADHSFVAPALHAAGAAVVVPNYALCPAVTIPQITLQMVRALAWTWRHAQRLNADASRITVIGHSAGGHLAAMMMACHWPAFDADLPAQLVKNALSVSGLYDLAPLARTPFLKNDLRLTAADVRRASPALLPAPAHGELYTVAGGDESAEFLRHNRLIQQAWGPQRVPVCEALPGLNHFSAVDALTQPKSQLSQLVVKLLEKKKT